MVLLLDPYVDAILLLALAFLIVGIMRSLTPYLARIPWVGGSIANAAEGMARAISSACYAGFKGIDHALGVSFHAIAGFLGHSWGQLRAHAKALLEAATLLGALAVAIHGLKILVHRLLNGHHTIAHSLIRLAREFRGLEHRVKAIEEKVARGIGHDLRIRIKALEQEVAGIEDNAIPGLRAGVKTAEGEVSALQQWLGINAGTRWKEWVSGLVLAGLAALGLGGLNCDSNPFKNNSNACGLWGDLAALLGLATIAIEAADFQELVKEAQGLEHDVTVAIKKLWNIE